MVAMGMCLPQESLPMLLAGITILMAAEIKMSVSGSYVDNDFEHAELNRKHNNKTLGGWINRLKVCQSTGDESEAPSSVQKEGCPSH